MSKILVTGGKGQLASCIKQEHESKKKDCDITFIDYDELDITKESQVEEYFSKNQFDYLINCAAYTNVNKAEEDFLTANQVNNRGTHILARMCDKYHIRLIHISTDYVFGDADVPFKEEPIREIHALNAYGESKARGEQSIDIVDDMSKKGLEYMVIRTSSLYSIYGNNFVKTILNKIHKQENLQVVCNQVSSPTSAHDLAEVLYEIISKHKFAKGYYNFSNEGVISWYDFAKEIERLYNEWMNHVNGFIFGYTGDITPSFVDYTAKPRRLKMSAMIKEKIEALTGLEPKYWTKSLEYVVNTLIKTELTKTK